MSALDDLDAVDWAGLSHAYGDAGDVPDLLRGLQDPEEAEAALGELFGSILHQGTIYPATLPALRFLAALACDPATPDRTLPLVLLREFGRSVTAGWTTNAHYLPEGTDIAAFDRDARALFLATCEAILPCLDDAKLDIRAEVPAIWHALAPLPEYLAAALHRRLAVETEEAVTTAIAETLEHAGQLNEAERAGLATPARFATAAAALLSGRPARDRDLETLASLWQGCAEAYAEDGDVEALIERLVWACGEAILPLLARLAGDADGDMRLTAIVGWLELARASRRAAPMAVDGLEAMVGACLAPEVEAKVRLRLLWSIGEILSLAPPVQRQSLADALQALALADPAPAQYHARSATAPAGAPPIANDIRIDAAALLWAIDDPRWIGLAGAALADCPAEYQITARRAFATFTGFDLVWTGYLRPREPRPPAPAADLIRFLRASLQRNQRLTAGPLLLLQAWPDEIVRDLLPELLLCLPFQPRLAGRLLTRLGVQEAIQPLRRLMAERGDEACWAYGVLGVIIGDGALLDQGYAARPPRFLFEEDYLALWQACPTPAFFETCRGRLTGDAATSDPDRKLQLFAARAMAPIDGTVAIWPTVRAILDGGRDAFAEALAIALGLDKAIRPELGDLLEDIRRNSRKDWRGLDAALPVEAAHGLHVLGLGQPQDLAATCMATLRELVTQPLNKRTVQLACDLLVTLAAGSPEIRAEARACFDELLLGDRRVAAIAHYDMIALDLSFQAMVGTALAALAT